MIMHKKTDNYLTGLLSGKNFFSFFWVLLLLLGIGGKNTLGAQSTARVGILPFQIFSGDNVEYLNEVIAGNLSRQLSTKEGVSLINQEQINNLSRKKTGSGAFSLQELSLMAEKTGAHFLIYGSLTKIEDTVSIDSRVFTTLEPSPPHKDFVEGKDLDLLLKNLGNKISQHVSQVVLVSPPPETIAEMSQVAETTSSSQKEQPTKTQETLDKQASESAAVAIAKASPEQTAAAPKAPSGPTPSVPATGSETIQEKAPSSSPIKKPSSEEIKSFSQPEETKTQAPAMEQPSEPAADSSSVSSVSSSERPKKASDDKSQLLKPKAFGSSDQPVNITSDRMVADNRNRSVNFLGNVVAKRDDMIIFSDQISAVYTEKSQIEKIIARGNVKINQTDRTATCKEATFFQLRQEIVMTGNPKVWQGKNIITGDRIIIFVKEDRVEVESDKQKGGAPSRVNAIIYPGGKELKK